MHRLLILLALTTLALADPPNPAKTTSLFTVLPKLSAFLKKVHAATQTASDKVHEFTEKV